MSGQEIGYVGYSPDYKSKKPTYQDLCKKSWDLRHAAGYRAGVEAMRDAFKRHFKLGILEENDVDLIADKLLEYKEGE